MKKNQRVKQEQIRDFFVQSPGPHSAAQVAAQTGVENPHMQLKRLTERGFLMRVGRDAYVRAKSEALNPDKSLIADAARSGSPERLFQLNESRIDEIRDPYTLVQACLLYLHGALTLVAALLLYRTERTDRDARQFIIDVARFLGPSARETLALFQQHKAIALLDEAQAV
jgi:hypothetical protein